ncbi:MAG: hypothetical protein EHM91_01555 [Planctomycetota bacterium]|jgi:hypothetical protein|nr:MAG: hypothetical protein EHM91_01555 [Planctomycetota bacterium]
MARPPDGPTARDVHFALRLSRTELAVIDHERGQRSRSEFVRSLLPKDGTATVEADHAEEAER